MEVKLIQRPTEIQLNRKTILADGLAWGAFPPALASGIRAPVVVHSIPECQGRVLCSFARPKTARFHCPAAACVCNDPPAIATPHAAHAIGQPFNLNGCGKHDHRITVARVILGADVFSREHCPGKVSVFNLRQPHLDDGLPGYSQLTGLTI
jgi:hypothetical protein